MKWFLRGFLTLIAIYVAFAGFVVYAMSRPPEQFGRIMKHLPPALVFGAVPGPRIFTWVRRGTLQPGDMAPDFTLPRHDHSGNVTLSAFRGKQPVVLVFGSYT